MSVRVRAPSLGDVDELARINIETWRAAYHGLVPQARIDGMDLASYRKRPTAPRVTSNPTASCSPRCGFDGHWPGLAAGQA